MEASIATEPTSTGASAVTDANGNGGVSRNVGRIDEIQGVVIEAVFPDRLPEINHAITVARPAAAAADGRATVIAWLISGRRSGNTASITTPWISSMRPTLRAAALPLAGWVAS